TISARGVSISRFGPHGGKELGQLGVRRRRSLVGGVCAAVVAFGLMAGFAGPALGDAWPGLNGKIAYKSDPNNISTISPDGTTSSQLTTGTLENEEPHWSADGTKILFTRAGAADNSNQ